MSARGRLGIAGLGLLCILVLIALSVLAPPDGQERGELAQFIGGFHPLGVHLPIALLLLVPILEIAGRNPRRAALRASAGFVLGLGALSAIVTPYLGWLLAWSGGLEGEFVTQHMWGGNTVAAASLLCWALRGRMQREQAPGHLRDAGHRLPTGYVGMLTLIVLTVAFTGYRGGQLAHGEDHLTEHLPATWKLWIGVTADRKAPANEPPSTFYAARIAPIFEENCLVCHSANKRKGRLRLDSYAGLLKGGESGAVIKANAQGSELLRRVSLDPEDEDFMPAEGKPPLDDDERKLLALWINAGASPTIAIDGIAGAPPMKKPAEPWAPDYRAEQATIAELETALNIRLVPRSQNPTDGLILRTVSAPAACDDVVLAKLAPVARYIVDAELARTQVSDAGLAILAGFTNLRALDLSYTAITSAGVQELSQLPKLELLNLTATAVDDAGVASLGKKKTLKHLYLFETQVTQNRTRSTAKNAVNTR